MAMDMAYVSSTVQVSKKTLQLLNTLKHETGAKSHDELIRSLITEKKGLQKSMFGSNPKLKPFTPEEEAEAHEL